MSIDPNSSRTLFPLGFNGFKQSNWTPRAAMVLATAKDLAAPTRAISADDILLALECGDNQVSQVLRRLEISPSAALRRPAPQSWSRISELSLNDFDPRLDDFPQRVADEAAALGDRHLGSEHILLFLARSGISEVDLPYDRIKEAWLETMGRS